MVEELVETPPVPTSEFDDVAAHVPSPRKKVVELAVPEPRRAVETVPVERLDAFRAVRPEPLPVNDVPVTAPVRLMAVASTLNWVAVLPER